MTLTAHTEQVTAPAPEAAGVSLRRFLRPMEIHKSTGLPKALIYDALTSGDLPALDTSRPPRAGRKAKPRWMIDPADFETWLEGQKKEVK